MDLQKANELLQNLERVDGYHLLAIVLAHFNLIEKGSQFIEALAQTNKQVKFNKTKMMQFLNLVPFICEMNEIYGQKIIKTNDIKRAMKQLSVKKVRKLQELSEACIYQVIE